MAKNWEEAGLLLAFVRFLAGVWRVLPAPPWENNRARQLPCRPPCYIHTHSSGSGSWEEAVISRDDIRGETTVPVNSHADPQSQSVLTTRESTTTPQLQHKETIPESQ